MASLRSKKPATPWPKRYWSKVAPLIAIAYQAVSDIRPGY